MTTANQYCDGSFWCPCDRCRVAKGRPASTPIRLVTLLRQIEYRAKVGAERIEGLSDAELAEWVQPVLDLADRLRTVAGLGPEGLREALADLCDPSNADLGSDIQGSTGLSRDRCDEMARIFRAAVEGRAA